MVLGLSSRGSFEELQGEAAALEKKYEWLEAADVYEHAFRMVVEGDFLRGGKVRERIGYCLQRAAFQAESREEFLERLGKAVEAYEKAKGIYGELVDKQGTAWMSRCEAFAKYLNFYLTSDPSERRKLLDECFEMEKDVLTAFWNMGKNLEFCRTYNELVPACWWKSDFEWNREALKDILERGIGWGEKAVGALSGLDGSDEIARAHFSLATLLNRYTSMVIAEPEKQAQYRSKTIKHYREALELSEKTGDDYTAGLSQLYLGFTTARMSPRAYEFNKKALECGEKTRDNFLKGMALHDQAFNIYWEAIATDDPDHRIELAEEAMVLYDSAQNHQSLFNHHFPRSGKIGSPTPGGHAEYYLDRSAWETDRDKKIEFLEKSERAGREALKVAEESDIPNNIGRMHHILSRSLTDRAKLEQDVDVKRSLLEEALIHRERNIEIMEKITVFYWNLGVYYNLLGHIKLELAYIQPDLDKRNSLLEDSALTMEKALRNIDKSMPSIEKRDMTYYFAPQSAYQDDFGAALSRLYEATKKPEHIKRAVEAWHDAIKSANKLEMVSRIAELYWKIAKAQAILGEHLKAAENFNYASESYGKAAEKIPQLKDFYQEHEAYMSAWSEFERAKHSHAEKRYMQAKEHYEKAAELHKSTERWSHLAPNYLAWARLGEAEDLSRREETEEARDLFQQATGLFTEAKRSIEIKLRTIQDEEERKLLGSLAQASDIRREYCLGRTALEEARILDRQGYHLASSRRYGSATETFKEIAGTSEEAQKELQPLVCLCQAWQKMTQAEAKASPELYLEASKLFEEAMEHSQDERSRRLALGHSRFCLALESGARFEDTSDLASYNDAIQNLESAARHYVRAGFKSAADYAEATQRLFDAYAYMDSAGKESDPLKKARFYLMAERVLETSAGGFLTAKHPEKSEEVQRLLVRAREKRELASSLSEVMHAPTTVSTTEAFTAPSPTREVAVGLDRFENADIQANLILGGKEIKVGDNVDIEIELVNAGKAPAQLIKVEEIIPRGFEVSSAPDICRVEDSYLDMKGRTLMPLKTAELKLVLKPLDKGTYQLRPRVLYLDEAGKYRSHEPEPATVVVKELGIKGWLRGPTR